MIKLSKIRIKYLRTDRGGKEKVFYSTREIGQVIEEGRFCGLIDKVLDIEGVEHNNEVWKYCCEQCGIWCETSNEMRSHYMNGHGYSPVDATLVTRTSYTKVRSSCQTTKEEN